MSEWSGPAGKVLPLPKDNLLQKTVIYVWMSFTSQPESIKPLKVITVGYCVRSVVLWLLSCMCKSSHLNGTGID